MQIAPSLHSTRLSVLLYLAQHGDRAKSRDMRLALGLNHRATLTNHRKRLTAAGLIRADGRVFELTSEGRNALAGLASAIESAIGRPAPS